MYTIQNSHMKVTVAQKGAELQSILGADGVEYLWQGDPKYWADRALNIFPYVARLTQGCYYLDGQLYQMQIHGVALYQNFRLLSNDGTRMVLELTDNDETYQQYPRHFAFRVIYELQENMLVVIFEVDNRDERIMYFGLGGHPGFNVPLVHGKSFDEYQLRFAQPCEAKRVGFNEECFITGEQYPYPLHNGQELKLRHDLFDEDAIVLTDMARQVTLETEDDPHRVTVTYPEMGYLGLWHWPRTDAPYVCIEPWCSLPAKEDTITVLEEQEDLLKLQPGESYRNRWTIEI